MKTKDSFKDGLIEDSVIRDFRITESYDTMYKTPKKGAPIKPTSEICGPPRRGNHCPNCQAQLDSNLPNPGGIEIKLDGRSLTMTRKWFKLSAATRAQSPGPAIGQ